MMKSTLRKSYIAARYWWRGRSVATRALPHYLLSAVTNFIRTGAHKAAALAFFSILSVFPLTLLLAVGISNLLGEAVAQQQISNGLRLFLPSDTITLVQENIAQSFDQGGSFGVIAVVVLIWTALGLFSNLTLSLDDIFRVPKRSSLWRQRILAFGMTVILIVLVMTSFVTSGLLRLVDAVLTATGTSSIWIGIGTVFLPFGLDMMIFALLFRFVPARFVYWDAVWTAAIVGAVGWELAKAAFAWYITNLANYQFVYGGIATVIVLMLWAYVIASIILLSAELCARLNEWLHFIEDLNRREAAPPPILVEPEYPQLPPAQSS